MEPDAAYSGAQTPASPWRNQELGEAGKWLLFAGWILAIMMAVFSLLALLLIEVMRRSEPRFFEGFAQGMPMMGWMWGLGIAMMMLAVIALVAAAILLFLGWNKVLKGEHQSGGMLGVVGGAIGIVFGGFLPGVGLLGGIFVLVAAQRVPPPATEASRGDPQAGDR